MRLAKFYTLRLLWKSKHPVFCGILNSCTLLELQKFCVFRNFKLLFLCGNLNILYFVELKYPVFDFKNCRVWNVNILYFVELKHPVFDFKNCHL
jgi:hypothetical protein